MSWDQIFNTFVEKTSPPNLFCLLVTPKSPAGQKFLMVEKQSIIALVQDRDCMEKCSGIFHLNCSRAKFVLLHVH